MLWQLKDMTLETIDIETLMYIHAMGTPKCGNVSLRVEHECFDVKIYIYGYYYGRYIIHERTNIHTYYIRIEKPLILQCK